MPDAVAIGPVVLPVARVAVLLALFAAIAATGAIARRRGLDPEAAASAEWGAAAFVVGARIGHVVAHPGAYRDAPWAAAYLWQPGFVPWVGALAALIVLAWRLRRRPPASRRSHLTGVAAGALVGALAFVAFVGVARVAAGEPAVAVGDPLPAVTFENLDGERVSTTDLRGDPVVLNLWATWCPPCRREMPALQALHQRYADAGMQVVGVSVGERPAAVRAFLEETPVRYPLWLDPPGEATDASRSLHARLGGFGLPTTVFVDDSGVIRSVRVGALSGAAMAAEARPLLRSR